MIRTAAGNPHPTRHADVVESEAWLVAECREVGVVTQGKTLDETVANLREALAAHLDGDELARLGLSAAPRLVVRFNSLW